jgi:hypothetical protein
MFWLPRIFGPKGRREGREVMRREGREAMRREGREVMTREARGP